MIGRMFLTTFGLWMLWVFIGFAGEDLFTGGGGAIYGAAGFFAGVVYFFPIILGLPLIYAVHGGGFSTREDWQGHGLIVAMSFALITGLLLFFMREDMNQFRTPETFWFIFVASCPLIISWVVYATVMNSSKEVPRPPAPGGGGTKPHQSL